MPDIPEIAESAVLHGWQAFDLRHPTRAFECSTSLAMAPAMLIGGLARRFVDLDGPLLLTRDREPGIKIANSIMQPPGPEVWG